MVPVKLVYLSYCISTAYVTSHSVYCGLLARTSHPGLAKTPSDGHKSHHYATNHSKPATVLSPAKAFLDTLLWQGLASVVIPGLVINRTCALSRLVLSQLLRRQLSHTARQWIVMGIGLGAIPLIIHPIDRTVDKFMDLYMRPLFLKESNIKHN